MPQIILSFSLSLIFLLALTFCSVPSLARLNNVRSNLSSLIINLSRSRNVISQNYAISSSLQSDPLIFNVVEPLRAIRDGYLMSLNIGTPPQVIQVYMDTGSDLAWVPCGNLSFDCIECDAYYRTNKLTNAFSPLYSSSSLRVSCGSSFCTQIHNSDNPYDPCIMAGCPLITLLKGTCSRPCPGFAYTYGGDAVVVGTLTSDLLRIHSSSPSTTKDIERFRFGCIGSTYKEPLGIAGFGRGSLSLPSQLGFLQKGFSHCFVSFKFASNPNISSPLIIGEMAISSKETSKFTSLLTNPTYPNYYYIGLEAITISNMTLKKVPSKLQEIDSKGNGGMMIDSGTTYTHLSEPFYSEFLSELDSMILYPRATKLEKQSGFDLCYEVPCPNNNRSFCMENDDLPSITFHFVDDVRLVLPKGNNFYAISPPSNFSVVKCLLYQGVDDEIGGPSAIFGSFQQQNIEVVYDLENERIGFNPMDCAATQ
ncbi:probable aspartyl protease At4g16563 [Amaranthus tricolor]|uniref:probable aspartyl protease At4g16563 n=1 Tax=Amaranthus tricolor TaxID=29722 RepID=UPI002582C38A|nr:probable aspartyl protease At4g16563 [Amaranthus tricolor]